MERSTVSKTFPSDKIEGKSKYFINFLYSVEDIEKDRAEWDSKFRNPTAIVQVFTYVPSELICLASITYKYTVGLGVKQ